MTTYQPILSKQPPTSAAGAGGEKEVYSSDLFNTSTGIYSSQGATYPVTMAEDLTSRELYYFGGAQTVSGSAPVFIVQPFSQSVAVGTVGSQFGATATDNSISSETIFTWYVIMGGSYIPTAYTSGVTRIPGAAGSFVSSSTVIVPTTAEYNGSAWYVIATNPGGATQSNTAILTITGITTKPVITGDGYSSTMNYTSGSTAAFSTNAWGDPTMSFEWHKVNAGGTVGGAGDNIVATNAGTDNGAPYHIFTSSYTTPALSGSDEGAKFYCHITNPYGFADSTVCTMVLGVAPTITSGALSPVTVIEGNNIDLTGTATGTAIINYTWMVSTAPMSIIDMVLGGYLNTSWTGTMPAGYIGTSAHLVYTALNTPNLNGKYLCLVVMNAFGSVKSNDVLITQTAAAVSAPTVVTNPSSGAGPTFTAVFTGSFLTFQWQQYGIYDTAWSNSSIISTTPNSTTSILDLSTLILGYSSLNGYQFRCIASNGTGSATTSAATLIIGTPPPTLSSVTISPTTHTFNGVFDNQQFTATAHWSDLTTTDITNSATWSCSANLGVGTYSLMSFGATYAAPGQAYVLAAGSSGSATVTATYIGQDATATCTNTGSAFSSVTLSPLNTSVAVGSTVVYTATAHYANATTADVSTFSIWSSSIPAYATIGNSGALLGLGSPWGYPTASGISNGTTVISCAVGSVIGFGGVGTGTTNLTVNSGGGGGGGGSSTWHRPTTGTGSAAFGGAIDTTTITVDSGTFTSKDSTTSQTYTFTGFGTGTVTGTLNIRCNATTQDHLSQNEINESISTIEIDYSSNLGAGVQLYYTTGTSNDTTSATVITSPTLTNVDLSTLSVTLSLDGQAASGAGTGRVLAAHAIIDLYDIVFLT